MDLKEAEEEWQQIVDTLNRFNLSSPHCLTVFEDEQTSTWVDLDCYKVIWLYISNDITWPYGKTLSEEVNEKIHDADIAHGLQSGRHELLEVFSYDVEKMMNFIRQYLTEFGDAFKKAERDSWLGEGEQSIDVAKLDARVESEEVTNFISNYMAKGLFFVNFVNSTLSTETKYKVVFYSFTKHMKEEFLAFRVREFSPF